MKAYESYIAELQAQLFELPSAHRVTFGAWCCERLYPKYLSEIGNSHLQDVIRPTLNRIWEAVLGNPLTEPEFESTRNVLISQEFEDDGSMTDAINMAGATLLVLDSLKANEIEMIKRVAETMLDIADREALDDLLGKDAVSLPPHHMKYYDNQVESHPVFVAEVKAQRLFVDHLKRVATLDESILRSLLELDK